MAYETDYSLSITLMAHVESLNKWILDTRATYHLRSCKELLVDFNDNESSIVVMKNDQPCRKNEDRNISSQDVQQSGQKIGKN